MVSYGVWTSVFPIVKANTPSIRVYQLSHGNNRDFTRGFKELC